MPGLIWVRDSMVGDVMVDRSFRVERLRPLGLRWAATRAWEPEAFLELAGSLGAILESGVAERVLGSARAHGVVIGSSAAGPSSRRMWKERRASLRAIVSDARVCVSPRVFSAR
jgi:hypothetical protein